MDARSPGPVLILVNGPPASGKTTLATRLAADLRLPLIAKDRIKEILFDTLGWSDRAWSRRLGGATMELLYAAVEAQIAAGCPCVVESNFHREWAGPRFEALRAQWPYRPIELNCYADGPVLVARFLARAQAGTRHPGHAETGDASTSSGQGLGEWLAQLARGAYPDLALGGPLLRIDTSDWTAVDYPAIRAWVTEAAGQRPDSGV